MKRLLFMILLGTAVRLTWGQPGLPLATNTFAQRVDETFDRSRLKSIMLKYEKKITSEAIGEDHKEIFLVLDGKKLFIRMQYLGPWRSIDARVDPPIVTTNWSPKVSYLWCTGEQMVKGYNTPDVRWEIYPIGTRTPPFLDEEVMRDVDYFLYLLTPSFSRELRLLGEKSMPGGRTYLFGNPGTGINAKWTVSDADGGGLAPNREVDSMDGKVLQDTMWSGWKNYNGIWVPQHFTSSVAEATGMRLEEYTLLSVEKVNEPIPARWFMPQFPAGPLSIMDHTVSPPLEMDNVDLDGNPYTGSEEDEMPQDNE